MNFNFTRLLTVLLVFTCSITYGKNYWSPFPGKQPPSTLPMSVNVNEYTVFTLHQNEMKGFLNALSTHPDHALELTIPAPDGSMRTFNVWKTPMMEKELAAKYPDIQTFTGYAADDQHVTAKIDYTPYGFRAYVLDGPNSYLIDPYSETADGYYVAYYQKDLKPSSRLSGCLREGLPGLGIDNELKLGNGTGAKQNGSVRRIYRLAISCTGEYAIAVAGPAPTVALVTSKIVSTINRVNGVYEKELSTSFNIINANDQIVFIDPNNDPYTCNSNLDCLIGEGQTTITNTIGNANFDIGHVLATAGGGLAALNALCADGVKASGTSSSTGPNDFHVILHEMGHQFGANHTFSANTGGCNGNGKETNAYEPGSGSTIMSYGGLCNPNNVTNSSQNYFHVTSLKEMHTLLTTQGATCGDQLPGTPPVTLPEITDTLFNIPKNTPFELKAPLATVSQANAEIRYNWEQFDLGNFDSQEAQNGNATEGPIFKSQPPSLTRTRTFPTVNYILDDSYTGVGERLPLVARELHFKLTARSVYQGWGTFDFTDEEVKVNVANVGEFRVTGPDADAVWNPNETKQITWNVGGTTSDPINCGFVNIYLSLDDGQTFPYVLVANAPNTGSYDYQVYDVNTTKGRIKVQGTGHAFMDIGQGRLTITGTETGIQDIQENASLSVFPNPASNVLHLANSDLQQEYDVTMVNIVGAIVWSGKLQAKKSIATDHLAKGIYMLKFKNKQSGESFSKKVSLQ